MNFVAAQAALRAHRFDTGWHVAAANQSSPWPSCIVLPHDRLAVVCLSHEVNPEATRCWLQVTLQTPAAGRRAMAERQAAQVRHGLAGSHARLLT